MQPCATGTCEARAEALHASNVERRLAGCQQPTAPFSA